MHLLKKDFLRKAFYGILATGWNLKPSLFSSLALPELQLHVELKKLSLVHTCSFRSLRSCRKNKKTETLEFETFVFWVFLHDWSDSKDLLWTKPLEMHCRQKSHCDLQSADLLERDLFARQRSTHS